MIDMRKLIETAATLDEAIPVNNKAAAAKALTAIRTNLMALQELDADSEVSHMIAHGLFEIATDMKVLAGHLRGVSASKWERKLSGE
jgi:hypothetical protein